MRRVFTPQGEMDEEQQLTEQPDEIVAKKIKLRMEQWPNETFTQAKQGVLRENLALAKAYAKQFE